VTKLGVVLVAFNSAGVILECLESLFGAEAAERLAVVVVDNASSDGTPERVLGWASGAEPFAANPACPVQLRAAPKPVAVAERAPGEAADGPLTLVRSPVNGGFAYGVNRGLEALKARDDVFAFWVLNPDSVVPPHTPARFLAAIDGRDFGMTSSRCIYYERPDLVQTDGGFVDRRTGVCHARNIGAPVSTPLPDPASLDFVTGANTIVSRRFLDEVGLMPEDYFLYYEEVDWAFRRGAAFPIELVDGAEIYHHGGTSIGSGGGGLNRRPTPFANYFNHRNRLRFVARHMPQARASAAAWTAAKAAQVLVKGGWAEAEALVAGALDRPPPAPIAARIKDPAARALAFGRGR